MYLLNFLDKYRHQYYVLKRIEFAFKKNWLFEIILRSHEKINKILPDNLKQSFNEDEVILVINKLINIIRFEVFKYNVDSEHVFFIYLLLAIRYYVFYLPLYDIFNSFIKKEFKSNSLKRSLIDCQLILQNKPVLSFETVKFPEKRFFID